MDNGPRELLHQAPQQGKAIEAGRMSAFEPDLQGVLADQRYVADAELFIAERLDPRKASWHSRLAAALRAWACPTQLLARVGRALAVFPRDLHHLAGAVDVDLG